MSTMKEDIFGDIVLDREEAYVAKEHDCWAFCSKEDTKRGIKLEFGNMIAGFRIEAGGKLFTCSEALYLCGQFSLRGAEYEALREALRNSAGVPIGFSAERTAMVLTRLAAS